MICSSKGAEHYCGSSASFFEKENVIVLPVCFLPGAHLPAISTWSV